MAVIGRSLRYFAAPNLPRGWVVLALAVAAWAALVLAGWASWALFQAVAG